MKKIVAIILILSVVIISCSCASYEQPEVVFETAENQQTTKRTTETTFSETIATETETETTEITTTTFEEPSNGIQQDGSLIYYNSSAGYKINLPSDWSKPDSVSEYMNLTSADGADIYMRGVEDEEKDFLIVYFIPTQTAIPSNNFSQVIQSATTNLQVKGAEIESQENTIINGKSACYIKGTCDTLKEGTGLYGWIVNLNYEENPRLAYVMFYDTNNDYPYTEDLINTIEFMKTIETETTETTTSVSTSE